LLGGRTLPEELPDVEFHDVEVRVTPATGAFSLGGKARADWDFGGTAAQAQIDLELDHRVQQDSDGRPDVSHVDATITVRVEAPVAVTDEVAFEGVRLHFAVDQGSGWSVSGGLNAALFDHDLELEARYENVNGARTLRLATAADEPMELVNLEGVGTFGLTRLAIDLSRHVGGTDVSTTASWNRYSSTSPTSRSERRA
jgi:hypothetical protein